MRQKVRLFQYLCDDQKSSTIDATVNRRLNKVVDSCGKRGDEQDKRGPARAFTAAIASSFSSCTYLRMSGDKTKVVRLILLLSDGLSVRVYPDSTAVQIWLFVRIRDRRREVDESLRFYQQSWAAAELLCLIDRVIHS